MKKIKSDEIDLGLNINSVSKKKKINIIFNFKDKELKFADETLTKQFMVSILNNKKIFDTNMTDLNDTNMTDPIFWDYKEFNRKLIELIGQNAALINKNDNFDEKFKKKEEDNKKYILRFSCNCNENNKSFKEEILTKILNFLSNKNNYLLYERNLDRLQTIYPKNKIFSTFTIEITFTQN